MKKHSNKIIAIIFSCFFIATVASMPLARAEPAFIFQSNGFVNTSTGCGGYHYIATATYGGYIHTESDHAAFSSAQVTVQGVNNAGNYNNLKVMFSMNSASLSKSPGIGAQCDAKYYITVWDVTTGQTIVSNNNIDIMIGAGNTIFCYAQFAGQLQLGHTYRVSVGFWVVTGTGLLWTYSTVDASGTVTNVALYGV